MRWETKEKKFVHKLEWEEEDNLKEESDNSRTSRELKNVMNSVYKNIQFTTEIPEDFADKRLPTLDFTMWLSEEEDEKNRGKLKYSFYEKEVSSKFCIQEKSAMADNSKMSSLSQDLIRRMMNTSEVLEQKERDCVVEKYIVKLELSDIVGRK